MRCGACGFEPIGDFPSFINYCFADASAHATPLSEIVRELVKVPNTETGDRVIAIYVCPRCGTLRANVDRTK